MDEMQIRELIRSRGKQFRRGWLCPDDNRLAEYATGKLDGAKRKSLESHAANCTACTRTLAFLAQSADWLAQEEVPPALLYRAKSLVSQRSPTVWPKRWVLATATVACIVVVSSLIVLRLRSEQSSTNPPADLIAQKQESQIPTAIATPSPDLPQPTTTVSVQKPKLRENTRPDVRGEASSLKPSLIFPREGAVIRPAQVQFNWTPVQDAVSYEVRIAKEDGALVSAVKTDETRLTLIDDSLKAGEKYFVTIVAHLTDGRPARSEMVSFRVASRK